MTHSIRDSIYEAISSIRLIDPHTHINPHNPASSTLADILGYHYYTELVHSAGMPREEIEQQGLQPRELVRRLVQGLPNIENTANYQWLISICQTFFGFQDTRIDQSNWEALYDASEARMNSAEWPQMVLDQSNVEAVFLTNDFDDDLEGFDAETYIPCLRTDDLVFHLAKPETRQRLAVCTGMELDGTLQSLRESLDQRFQHFVSSGARACAISIPPSFEPLPVSDGRAMTALDEVLRRGTSAEQSHQAALSRRVFWTLAELCDQYGLPFDLMIGVNRGVYPGGVYQGQDLYDSRVSLIQYRELFNTFRNVKFPVSVLASVTNQELVSYAWIFPNVITNGHWWYSNTPSFITRDAAARLEAVPRNNQIGYYSDAYKLEFVWPKFDMYRRILAEILADQFVGFNGWSEERAIEFGRQVLRDNVDETFPPPADPDQTTLMGETYGDDTIQIETEDLPATLPEASAAATAALAAGAIGIVEVHEFASADETEAIDDVEELAETREFADADDEQELDVVDEDVADDEDTTLNYIEDETEEPLESPIGETLEVEQVEESDQGTVGFTVDGDDEYDTVDEEELPELPTVIDVKDTVRLDEDGEPEGGEPEDGEPEDGEPEDGEPEGEASAEQTATVSEFETVAESIDLDQLPTDDEVQAVDVPDVELSQSYDEAAHDADAIEAEADESPLHVGDILDDEEVAEPVAVSDPTVKDDEIRMLRGEDSFVPDEDSMKLMRDPVTGELTFPVEADQESVESEANEVDGSAETVFMGEDEGESEIDYVEEVLVEDGANALDDDVVVEADDEILPPEWEETESENRE